MSETRIAMADLESNYSKFVVDEPNDISNLIIDPFEEKMYFKTGVKIKQANFDGSDNEVIHESKNKSIKTFALDWVERKMYWMYTTYDRYWIYVGDVNFDEGRYILYANPANPANPSNLALDPYARLVMLHVRIPL